MKNMTTTTTTTLEGTVNFINEEIENLVDEDELLEDEFINIMETAREKYSNLEQTIYESPLTDLEQGRIINDAVSDLYKVRKEHIVITNKITRLKKRLKDITKKKL